MARLEMDTIAGVINLEGYLQDGAGFQITSGLTGMGLPPVETDWIEGAADGSRFRHSRTLPRDLDLPLWLHAEDRAGLKALVHQFSLALSGPITLRWVDGSDVWTLDCRRVGGGRVTYGEGTTGDEDIFLIATLRAGDPYWKLEQTVGRTAVTGAITFNNPKATAPSYPVWTLTGPLSRWTATAPDGRSFTWRGELLADQTIVIDTEAGTVTAGGGGNMYHQLDPAPKFFKIPPGSSTITITRTGTGNAQAIWHPRAWMVI